MAPRFLGKTTLVGAEPLRLNEALVLEAHGRLRAAVARMAGTTASELFSEPIVTWSEGGTISWYTEADGEPFPLAAVPSDRRNALEVRLRDTLARLQPLLGDPQLGPLLQRALCVLSPAGLWAVGDHIVLTEWGLTTAGLAGSDMSLLLQQSPIGRFLPPITAPEQTPMPPPSPRATAGPAPYSPPPMPVQPRIVSPPRTRDAGGWWLVPAGLATAAIFLALGYWKGSLLASERASARPNTVSVLDDAGVKDATERQLALNAALEKQIEERRRLLAGEVCQIDPATTPRVGPNRAALPPPATVPPPPGGSPFSGTLADLLKQALVMVVVPTGEGQASLGSGFFVTPEIIATNRHVIENNRDGKVGVISQKLGKLVRAEILASTPSSTIGTMDVALLRVPAMPSIQPLSMTTTVAELDPVIAAGYPALVLQSDAATKRLLEDGDLTAAPQLVLTDGRINAIQTSPSGLPIMPHSASISGGNSGGPLVDACGRVVGVNTFITTDQEQTAHVNYAQKSDPLIEFMKEHGAQVTVVAGPCVPAQPTAPPATPAAVAPTPAPPAH